MKSRDVEDVAHNDVFVIQRDDRHAFTEHWRESFISHANIETVLGMIGDKSQSIRAHAICGPGVGDNHLMGACQSRDAMDKLWTIGLDRRKLKLWAA